VQLEGVWIPLVTPFRCSQLDLGSLERLVEGFVGKGISGLVVGGTTGESPVLSEEELPALVRCAKAAARGRVPVLAGAGGADTRAVIQTIGRAAQAGADGVLSVSPYFSRPDQRGILAHFRAVAASTPLPLVLYNNPSRTAARMHNDTIRRLAELENVVGLKDCAGDAVQSMELLLDPPPGFAILTGEDALFYPMLALGAAGGILAAAHWATESFVEVWRAMRKNDHHRARQLWVRLLPGARLLFEEPSPAPIKHLLAATGQLASGELRLPLVPPSDALKLRLAALGGGQQPG
jgi:4-hydroxy-tetrahydrodipicolinate synthase